MSSRGALGENAHLISFVLPSQARVDRLPHRYALYDGIRVNNGCDLLRILIIIIGITTPQMLNDPSYVSNSMDSVNHGGQPYEGNKAGGGEEAIIIPSADL